MMSRDEVDDGEGIIGSDKLNIVSILLNFVLNSNRVHRTPIHSEKKIHSHCANMCGDTGPQRRAIKIIRKFSNVVQNVCPPTLSQRLCLIISLSFVSSSVDSSSFSHSSAHFPFLWIFEAIDVSSHRPRRRDPYNDSRSRFSTVSNQISIFSCVYDAYASSVTMIIMM